MHNILAKSINFGIHKEGTMALDFQIKILVFDSRQRHNIVMIMLVPSSTQSVETVSRINFHNPDETVGSRSRMEDDCFFCMLYVLYWQQPVLTLKETNLNKHYFSLTPKYFVYVF